MSGLFDPCQSLSSGQMKKAKVGALFGFVSPFLAVGSQDLVCVL